MRASLASVSEWREYCEVSDPVEASSLYGGCPLFSFGFGVQFDVGDYIRPVYARVFSICLLWKVLTVFSSFLLSYLLIWVM